MDEIDNILRGNYTDARLKLTSVKSAVFFASGQERDFLLSFTDKILLLLDELWSDTASLNASVSSLRYILEALVKTERFLQDDEYLKVFYSQYLFDHKTRLLGLKKRLEKEIELLDKYIYKESKILSALSTIEDYDDKVQKNIDDLYKELDSEFSVYLINAKIHGFDFLKYHLETKQLPGLIESINKLESGIKAEGLTESKTYTRLRDEFKAYNLQDEYDFTYSYTSDLIHCRSYSINTPLEMDIIEKQMFKTMSLNFVNKIASNLLKLGDMPEGIRYFNISENHKPSEIIYKTTANDGQIKKWAEEFDWSIDKITLTLEMKASPSLEFVFFENTDSGIPSRYISYQNYETFNFKLISTVDKNDILYFESIEEVVSNGWALD